MYLGFSYVKTRAYILLVPTGAHELPKAAKERWSTYNVRSILHIRTMPYMEHRVSGLVADSSLSTVDSVYLVTRCKRTGGCQQCMQYAQLYLSPTLHVADTYLQYTYQIMHAIQIRPGLPSWDVERKFRHSDAEFDAPSPPSAAHALLDLRREYNWSCWEQSCSYRLTFPDMLVETLSCQYTQIVL